MEKLDFLHWSESVTSHYAENMNMNADASGEVSMLVLFIETSFFFP